MLCRTVSEVPPFSATTVLLYLLAGLVLQHVQAADPVHPHAVSHQAVQHAVRVHVAERRSRRVGGPQSPEQLAHEAPQEALREEASLPLDEPLRQGLRSRVEIGHEEQRVPVDKRLFPFSRSELLMLREPRAGWVWGRVLISSLALWCGVVVLAAGVLGGRGVYTGIIQPSAT